MKKLADIFRSNSFVFAQNKTELGTVLDAKTQQPLAFVVVSVQNTNAMQLTETDGKFIFDDLICGSIGAFPQSGLQNALFPVTIQAGQPLDLGTIMLEKMKFQTSKRSLIRLFENDLTDDNSGSENFRIATVFQRCFSKAASSPKHVSGSGLDSEMRQP
jgi:hypothetical protein